MLKSLYKSGQFKKDSKKLSKKNKEGLKEVLIKLCNGERLDRKYCDHPLKGNYKGCWDCHINPDLVLIYEKHKDMIICRRIGSHSELFK